MIDKIILGIFAILMMVWVFVYVKVMEHLYCTYIRKQPPMVASVRHMRAAVADEINRHYPDARTVCDVGTGYGGLARHIARHTRCHVTGIENMPVAVIVGWMGAFLCPRVRTVWADAFNYLARGHRFDIGVAYLGTHFTPQLAQRLGKNYRVLILLNFDVPGMAPTRVIETGNGYVRYCGKKYPNRLYVYEF